MKSARKDEVGLSKFVIISSKRESNSWTRSKEYVRSEAVVSTYDGGSRERNLEI